MAKFSSALKQYLLCGGDFKRAFRGAVLNIYSGAAPVSADDPVPGGSILLVQVTKGGQPYNYPNDFGLVDIYQVTIASVANTSLTINGISVSYTAGGSDTVSSIARALERIINTTSQLFKDVIAFAVDNNLYISGKDTIDTITISGSSNVTITQIQAANPVNSLSFDVYENNILKKSADTWQGNGLADGTAGWFRLNGFSPEFRIDGTVGTFGADLNLSDTRIYTNVPVIINAFQIAIA